MKRLDVALVEAGLAPTRAKARQMIDAGEVEVRSASSAWVTADRASLPVRPEIIRLKTGAATLRYVSRGGLKLEGALERLHVDVRGRRCLDLGISTGGFSDCLLQRGAAAVCGIDVGHGQLTAKIASDPRVTAFEGVHVRDLKDHAGVREWMNAGPLDLCVADLSFISFTTALPAFAALLPAGCHLLALIKPQFEVGASHLDKRGVVRDPSLFDDVRGRVLRALEKYGFSTLDYFPSSVKGQDGNQEFFVYSHRS